MNRAIVVVDIGNTETTLGLFHGQRVSNIFRLPTHTQRRSIIPNALKRLCGKHNITGAGVCSVVPEYNELWQKKLKVLTGQLPMFVTHRCKLGIGLDYPRPGTIGADRLANASAAAYLYGGPVIVMDFGTALAFDVVSRNNAYIGGAIVPGLPCFTDYLSEKTSLLPRVEFSGRASRSKSIPEKSYIGKSTRQAMLIGMQTGYAGLVRAIVEKIEKGLGKENVNKCVTGGNGRIVISGLDMEVTYNPHLTLLGVGKIYELNA